MVELQEFLSLLKQWKAKARYESCKKVFTSKLWFHLQSMILGFESIVAIKLKEFPQSVIEPPIIKVARLHFFFFGGGGDGDVVNAQTWGVSPQKKSS